MSIKDLLIRLELSKVELDKELGVSDRTISRCE